MQRRLSNRQTKTVEMGGSKSNLPSQPIGWSNSFQCYFDGSRRNICIFPSKMVELVQRKNESGQAKKKVNLLSDLSGTPCARRIYGASNVPLFTTIGRKGENHGTRREYHGHNFS